MASIQCRNCKCGIHYHGEPLGIEFILIENCDLEIIVSSEFDSRNKIIDSKTGYPKLFRTDTITEDFPNAIKKFWKCPECGSLIFFDGNGRVLDVYVPVAADIKTDKKANDIIAVCFDDYQWDEITEAGIPDSQLAEKISEYNRITIGNQGVAVVDAKGSLIQQYKKI